MIQFIEDDDSGYAHRTHVNARSADATIAFAANFQTSGEKMTKSAVEKYGKIYLHVPLPIKGEEYLKAYSNLVASVIAGNNIKSINIAGNGISRLANYGISQEEVDETIYKVLANIVNNDGVEITSIRSGGQTGADEAGLKAAERLGIDSICLCPKGWRFRTEKEDISDEKKFKERFETKKTCSDCAFYSNAMMACMNIKNEGMRVFSPEKSTCGHHEKKTT